MSPRLAAYGTAALTAVVVVAEAAAVAVAGHAADRVYVGVAVCVATASAGLGLLIARRKPANVVAPLLCWMGLLAAVVSFSDTYTPAQARRHDLLPGLPDVAAAILVATWVWLYVAVALLMLFFPDGTLPGRGWRPVAVALPVVGVAIQVVMAVSPGPYDAPYQKVEHPFGDVSAPVELVLKFALFPAFCALLIAAAGSLWLRFRRGDELHRAQLKWFALASLALPGTVVLSWVGFVLTGTHDLAGLGLAVLYTALPVATTIAILRHDLYDVDRALSTTVTYAVGTAGLLALFTLLSVVGGLVFGRDSTVAAAGATALSVLALAPLRARLQRRVDRRLYPVRRAGLAALDDLRARTHAGEARPEQLEEVLRTALRDPSVRVGFAVPGAPGLVDAAGQPVAFEESHVSVSLGGRQIGAVAAGRSVSRQLLREVAGASALLVEVVRLRLELSSALRDVESSRARLLRIGYDERRRLERDLHDGAQQRLVSLGMSLRLAQRHLADGSVDLDGLLDQSVAELGTAVAELRQVAQGLRPSALDDGLQPALSSLTRTVPLPIDLHIAADQAVPEDIATTAYYVVSEAVTNAVKHAGAQRIGLRVVQDDGSLRVRVEDDGKGGASVRPGSGLAGLADRVAAAGGSLLVHSPVGRGTVVEAVLPCAS